MGETVIERRVCELALTRLGVRNLKLNVKGNTGWPDRMYMIPGGRPLFIEFKYPGEVPEPKQVYIHSVLTELGYRVETHDDAECALRAIARAVDTAKVSEGRLKVSARARRKRAAA